MRQHASLASGDVVDDSAYRTATSSLPTPPPLASGKPIVNDEELDVGSSIDSRGNGGIAGSDMDDDDHDGANTAAVMVLLCACACVRTRVSHDQSQRKRKERLPIRVAVRFDVARAFGSEFIYFRILKKVVSDFASFRCNETARARVWNKKSSSSSPPPLRTSLDVQLFRLRRVWLPPRECAQAHAHAHVPRHTRTRRNFRDATMSTARTHTPSLSCLRTARARLLANVQTVYIFYLYSFLKNAPSRVLARSVST